MNNTGVIFKAGKVIELAFATIIEGKESQFYELYFPKALPIVSKLGGEALRSYEITESVSTLDNPKMGGFFQWESIDAFNQLHNEAAFLEIKHLRDEALTSFSNALFYTVADDTELMFEEGEPYALIAHMDVFDCCMKSPLLDLTPVAESNKTGYSPVRIQLFKWNECCDTILQDGKTDIFKIKFNTPQ